MTVSRSSSSQRSEYPQRDESADTPALSVVIPVYYEEDCIHRCVRETVAVLESQRIDYEIVFVDDGSRDRTVEILIDEASRNPRLKLVELSRNHGKQGALTAGIHHARGRRILLMDPDLQESPEEIPRFVAKLDEGFDVVYGLRNARRDHWLNVVFSQLFWWLLEKMTGLDIPRGLSVMRIFNRAFQQRFLEYRESSRFIEGIMLHIGMRQATLPVTCHARIEGESKFTFRRKLNLALTAILDFSSIPLLMAIRCGVFLTGLGFLLALSLIVARVFFMEFQLGWPSLIVTMITGFGLQIFFTGIVGVYVGRTFLEAKQRPVFSVRRLTGFDDETTPANESAGEEALQAVAVSSPGDR